MGIRAAWAIFALITSLALVVLGFERAAKHELIKKQEISRIQTLARVVDATMIAHFRSIEKLLLTESARVSLTDSRALTAAKLEQINQQLSFNVETTPGVLTMTVLDAQGLVIASSRDVLRGQSFSDRDFFSQVKRSRQDQLVISAPIFTQMNFYTVVVERGIWDAKGNIVGAVALSLDPAYFTSLLSTVMYEPDLRAVLVHDDGGVFAVVGSFASGPGKNVKSSGSFLDTHQKSGKLETIFDATSYSTGDRRVGVLLTIQPDGMRFDKRMTIGITRNTDAVFADWRFETNLLMGIVAVVLGSSALGLFSRQRHRRQHEARNALLQAEREAAMKDRETAAAEITDLYENAPCGYHSLSVDGTILRINDTELRWLGYTKEEVVGKLNISHFLSPASHETFRANFPRFKETGKIEELELELVTFDGTGIPVLVTAIAIYDHDGKYIGSRSVLQDYRSTRSIQRSLKGALSASPVAVRIARVSDNRTVMVNAAYCQMLHCSEAQALSLDVRQFYVDKTKLENIRHKLQAHNSVFNELVELHVPDRPDVPNVWALASFMRIDYLGEPSVLAWLYDITERELLRQQITRHSEELEEQVKERTLSLSIAKEAAEAADRFKSAILGNIHHELRTPMNGILGYLGIAKRKTEDAALKDYMEKAETSATRLHKTLNDLVDLAAIESNKLAFEKKAFSVPHVIASVRDKHLPLAQSKNVAVRIAEWQDDLVELVADGDRIEQILSHLVSNAVRFSEHGEVLITVSLHKEADQSFLTCAVQDQGIGIAAEHLAQIFEPFFQVDGSLRRTRQGNGIGLALCWRLARAMGGALTVTSELGVGSTFLLRIPVEINVDAAH